MRREEMAWTTESSPGDRASAECRSGAKSGAPGFCGCGSIGCHWHSSTAAWIGDSRANIIGGAAGRNPTCRATGDSANTNRQFAWTSDGIRLTGADFGGSISGVRVERRTAAIAILVLGEQVRADRTSGGRIGGSRFLRSALKADLAACSASLKSFLPNEKQLQPTNSVRFRCKTAPVENPPKPLTTQVGLVKCEASFANFNATRRCHGYEECLRSIAAERNGTDSSGERSGGLAAGGSAAF